jgi:YHS domain-containing protein/thiol-disulfide isomerase/thioredoxin
MFVRNRATRATGTFLLFLAVATPAVAQDEPLHWEVNLQTAQRLAAETNRLVLMHFGGSWCPPCARLEHEVFSKPGFGRELTADYVAVNVDPREFPALKEKYGVNKYPSDVIITPRGELVYKLLSPKTASAYLAAMAQVADEARAKGMLGSPVAGVAQNKPSEREARYRSPLPRDARPRAAAAERPKPARRDAAPPSADRPQAPVENALRKADQPADQPPADDMVKLPPGSPSLVLEGFCPVSLREKNAWVAGDVRWGAIHHRRTYLFAGEAEQKAFLDDPDRYAPVLDGNDPVLALDLGRAVPGLREHGGRRLGRLYLFASEETRKAFNDHPERYSVEIRQASRPKR